MFLEQQNLLINNIALPPTWWDYFKPLLIAGIILILVLTPTIIFVNILKRRVAVDKSKFNIGKILITTGLSILALEYLFYLILETIIFIAIETSWDPDIHYSEIINRFSRYSMIQLGLLIIFSLLGFSYLILNIKDKEKQKKIVLSFIPLGLYFVFDFHLRFLFIKFGYDEISFFIMTRFIPLILFNIFIPIFIYSINVNNTKVVKRVLFSIILSLIFPFLYLFDYGLPLYIPYQWYMSYHLNTIIIISSILFLIIYTIIQVNLLKIEDNNLELIEDNSLLEAKIDDNSSTKIISEEVKADI